MEFKDYYTTLGLARGATPDEVKRSYRKLARKFHPDVSKEADAEARFKEVAEAYEALGDPERRAAYDSLGQRPAGDPAFQPPPGWNSGFEFSGRGDDPAVDHSDFFEALFGRHAAGARGPHAAPTDHHAKLLIDLQDAYRGARRTVTLRVPQVDAQGQLTLQARHLEVNIPRGVRGGQHLRLAGQGGTGFGDGPAGDLYLEIEFAPHPGFRVDGSDVYLDLPLAPWEAALGATLAVGTPDGSVQLSVPPGSAAGRKLRLKGQGIPSATPGDLYVLLAVALPPAETAAAQAAWRHLEGSFPDFHPRARQEA